MKLPSKQNSIIISIAFVLLYLFIFSRTYSTLKTSAFMFSPMVPVSFGFLLGRNAGIFGAFLIVIINCSIGYLLEFPVLQEALPATPFLIFLGAICGYSRDVTRRLTQELESKKDLEEKLKEQNSLVLQAAKMSSLGEMAAALAHEISNPIFVIEGRARQLKKTLAGSKPDPVLVDSYVSNIESMSSRITRIVQSLRTFSRNGGKDAFTSCPVQALFDETFVLCMERFKKNDIELTVDPIPKELILECRETQISQVLLNLLNNAYDAISEMPHPWVQISIASDEHVLTICVTDCGKGIPQEHHESLFQPFFTTKGQGKGVGIGLSISLGIVREHFGSLSLDTSCPNTRFVLSLPLKHPQPDSGMLLSA